MDTFQLKKIIVKFKYASKTFCGVIPIDYLPKTKLTKTCSFIVNTEDSSNIGKHWIAIYVPLKGNIEYFDPLGLKPTNQEIFEFIKLNNKNYYFNKFEIQSHSSYKCGLYCLFYILLRAKGISIFKISKFFNANSNINDDLIERIFKKLKLQYKIKYFI